MWLIRYLTIDLMESLNDIATLGGMLGLSRIHRNELWCTRGLKTMELFLAHHGLPSAEAIRVPRRTVQSHCVGIQGPPAGNLAGMFSATLVCCH